MILIGRLVRTYNRGVLLSWAFQHARNTQRPATPTRAKEMRLELIKEELQDENNKKAMDGPLKIKKQRRKLYNKVLL